MTSRRMGFLSVCVSLLIVAVAVGCGGGGGGTSTTPATVAQTTVQSGAPGTVTLKLTLPLSTSGSSTSRSAKSVPAGSRGIVVYAYPASAAAPSAPSSQCNTGASGSGCLGDLSLSGLPANNIQICQPSGGSKACSITVLAPTGADVFIVQLFDTEPTCSSQTSCALSTSANLLATGATTSTISDNASNSVSIVLGTGTFGPVLPGSAFSPPPQAVTTSSTLSGGSLVFSLPAGSVPATPPAQIGISTILQLVLPLSNARRPEASIPRTGDASPVAGNLLVYGLDFTLIGPTTLLQELSLSGTTFDVAGSLAASLDAPGALYVLNVAMVSGGTYIDVGNLTYSYANDILTVTGGESGILQSGLYILYLAPQSNVSFPIHVPSLPSNEPQEP